MAIKSKQKNIHSVRNYRLIVDGDQVKLVADELWETVEESWEERPSLRNSTEMVLIPLGKKVLSQKKQLIEYKLECVTVPEIVQKKRSGVPSLVVKYDNMLFWTKIPKRLNLSSCRLFGEHKCSCGTSVCKRLSALPEELGGCEKVRRKARNIWLYDFITRGYETFNISEDCCCFIVGQCTLYSKEPTREKLPWKEVEQRKKNIYDYMYY